MATNEFTMGSTPTANNLNFPGSNTWGSSTNYSNQYAPYYSYGELAPVTNGDSNQVSGGVWSAESDPRSTTYQSGGGTGGYVQPTYDPQAVAAYDRGIQNVNTGFGRTDTQLNVGNENILNNFNNSLNTLLGGKAVAERDYNTTKDRTIQDNVKTKSAIDFSTGQRANALQRLLGSRGAGNSSAARIAAPWAAAREGTVQRGQVSDAFGRNMQDMDTSWGDYGRNWDTERTNLDTSRLQQEKDLYARIQGSRVSLTQQLADLQAKRAAALGGDANASLAAAQPYLDRVNSMNGEIDLLGKQYDKPIEVKAPTYAAPELAQYNYDRASAPVMGGSAMTDQISPYLSLLLKGKKDNGIV